MQQDTSSTPTTGELDGLYLRSLGNKPRVHPNGFIQLDLSEKRRLHVWHPRLTIRQRTFSPIHNHIFSFTSKVYVGRLINVIYGFKPNPSGSHEEWQVRAIEGQNTELVKTEGGRINLDPLLVDVVVSGGEYTMDKRAFHETLCNEPTLTIMEKSDAEFSMGPNCQGASVIVPWNEKPDNAFRRDDHDNHILWGYIDDTINRYCKNVS